MMRGQPPFPNIFPRTALGAKSALYNCLVVIQRYELTYRVFDEKHDNTSTVVINVIDVNDNPPKFDNAIYNVTNVVEEETGISKNNPKYLLTVCLDATSALG